MQQHYLDDGGTGGGTFKNVLKIQVSVSPLAKFYVRLNKLLGHKRCSSL